MKIRAKNAKRIARIAALRNTLKFHLWSMRRTLFASDAHLTHLCEICVCSLVPSGLLLECVPRSGGRWRPTYSGFSVGEDKASRYHVEHWACKRVCKRAKHASRVKRCGCREMDYRSVMVQYVSARLDIIVTCLLLWLAHVHSWPLLACFPCNASPSPPSCSLGSAPHPGLAVRFAAALPASFFVFCTSDLIDVSTALDVLLLLSHACLQVVFLTGAKCLPFLQDQLTHLHTRRRRCRRLYASSLSPPTLVA